LEKSRIADCRRAPTVAVIRIFSTRLVTSRGSEYIRPPRVLGTAVASPGFGHKTRPKYDTKYINVAIAKLQQLM